MGAPEGPGDPDDSVGTVGIREVRYRTILLTFESLRGALILPRASRQSTRREAASLRRNCFTASLLHCFTALLAQLGGLTYRPGGEG